MDGWATGLSSYAEYRNETIRTYSTRTFIVNLAVSLLELCRPFTQEAKEKVRLIQPALTSGFTLQYHMIDGNILSLPSRYQVKADQTRLSMTEKEYTAYQENLESTKMDTECEQNFPVFSSSSFLRTTQWRLPFYYRVLFCHS